MFDADRGSCRCHLRVGNSQKFHRGRSGEYSRRGGSPTLMFSRYSCTSQKLWGHTFDSIERGSVILGLAGQCG